MGSMVAGIQLAANFVLQLAGQIRNQWGKQRREEERREELQALGAAMAEHVKQAVRDVVRGSHQIGRPKSSLPSNRTSAEYYAGDPERISCGDGP